MIKLSFWDWLAYVAIGIIIAYFLLKILKIIESPIEFDIVVLISTSYLLGRYAMKIDLMSNVVKQHSKDLKTIKENCKYCK